MPARNKPTQAACAARHYEKNKGVVKKRAKEWTDKRRIELTKYAQELKSKTPCKYCEKSYPYYVMDFHHRNPSKKSAGLSFLAKRGVSWKRFLEEIAKCDIVCSNCHRELTFGESGNG